MEKKEDKEKYLKKYLTEEYEEDCLKDKEKKAEVLNIEIEVEKGKIIKVKNKDYISREEYVQLQADYDLYKKIKEKGEGYCFANYKQLCLELGLKVKTGKSKEMQIQDFERFCSLKKVENKKSYTIESIRQNIRQKVDKKNSIYVNLIDLLIT